MTTPINKLTFRDVLVNADFSNSRITSAHLQAYAEFMTLKIFAQDFEGCKLSPPPAIDSIWHNHILQPKAYIDFCRRHADKLIEHHPVKAFDSTPVKRSRQQRTIQLYVAVYGFDPREIKGTGVFWNMDLLAPLPSANSIPMMASPLACSLASSVAKERGEMPSAKRRRTEDERSNVRMSEIFERHRWLGTRLHESRGWPKDLIKSVLAAYGEFLSLHAAYSRSGLTGRLLAPRCVRFVWRFHMAEDMEDYAKICTWHFRHVPLPVRAEESFPPSKLEALECATWFAYTENFGRQPEGTIWKNYSSPSDITLFLQVTNRNKPTRVYTFPVSSCYSMNWLLLNISCFPDTPKVDNMRLELYGCEVTDWPFPPKVTQQELERMTHKILKVSSRD